MLLLFYLQSVQFWYFSPKIQHMKLSILTPILLLAFAINVSAQQTISFVAPDNLKITADIYEAAPGSPVIILCHQANSSRGEFRNIAPKLVALGYTCVALDLRSGGENNGIQNLTTPDAIAKKFPTDFIYCEQDILAGMQFAMDKFKTEKVLLMGSSYSASLVLMIGAYDNRVNAVMAFSPGEYIVDLSISTYIQYLSIPTFATCAHNEIGDVRTMMAGMDANLLTLFPPLSAGLHGARSLDPANPSFKEYWTALEKFLKKIE